jgi:DNA-binding SARP family transcriptional activator
VFAESFASLLRIYLAGRIVVEQDGQAVIDERDFVGRQGRLAFAYVVAKRHRPVPRSELLAVLWGDAPPRQLEITFSAILSKLRARLRKSVRSGSAVDVGHGSIHLRLPHDAWVDLEAAANAIDEAEGALRGGDSRLAWSRANVAAAIGRRSFLPDEEAAWVHAWRIRLSTVLARALRCLSELSAANGETALALQYATEMVELDPFRETSYQHLMRLHLELGNRAEALRVFTRCRELFREELGASPSPETERLFLEILRAER